MASTVAIVADHRGVARPKVVGDEYVVNATVNITSYPTGGETVNAADLGLSTITAVTLCGAEQNIGNTGFIYALNISTAGEYASASSFTVVLTNLDGTNAQATNTTDVGMIRVRVWGLI